MANCCRQIGSKIGRIGYCCLSLGLYKSKFRGTTLTFVKKNLKEGRRRLREIWRHNLEELARVLDYNMEAGIWLYRMSSDLFPLADHKEFKMDWMGFIENTDFLPYKSKIRGYLAMGGRLTMHPGQFVSLASPSEVVVNNSIANLEVHGQVMDFLGLPSSHFSPINIHLSSGGAGGRNVNQFRVALDKLSSGVRERLVFENEDKSFWTWQKITSFFPEFPVTLDSHHHRINNEGESLAVAVEATAKTWKGVIPVRHVSEGATAPDDRSHHEWVKTIPSEFFSDGGLSGDVEVEAKMKDLATLFLKSKYQC
jgi:UV DNA damage endonuclease